VTHANILIVDDERGIREQLGGILRDEGFAVTAVASGEDALAALARELFDLILLDILLPGMDGIEVLRQTRAAGHRTPVVVISGHAGAELAVRAVREGAADFMEKPLALERVLVTVRNTLAAARLEQRLAIERDEEPVLTGVSPAIAELRRQILLAAPTDSRVLISGPNGSGKEVVATLLHRHSRRAAAPFVALNCAAIPAELIESELFGHLKGAFTGAVEAKRGKFELADGGTLFLDEIGDMSLLTQAKVLRVLQEARFTRLGGSQEVQVDVRVIAATNKDLEAEIAAGHFRQDLYFRLNVIPLTVPQVAQRREDIPLLVEEFLGQFSRRSGLRPKRVSEGAMTVLQAYSWPGNVREIKNVIERLMIMVTDDEIRAEHVQLQPGGERPHWDGELTTLKEARERFERAYVDQVVQRCHNNMSQAARVLGLERSHFYRKLRALGLLPIDRLPSAR
jgi:two-component system, NtrC family, nitrogen regulation response regulator NtrX